MNPKNFFSYRIQTNWYKVGKQENQIGPNLRNKNILLPPLPSVFDCSSGSSRKYRVFLPNSRLPLALESLQPIKMGKYSVSMQDKKQNKSQFIFCIFASFVLFESDYKVLIQMQIFKKFTGSIWQCNRVLPNLNMLQKF